MKKKTMIIALALGAAVTVGGIAAASSAQGDSLVSQSYLEGTFFSQLVQSVEAWVTDAFSPVYEEAESKLDRLAQGHLNDLGISSGAVQIPDGWLGSDQFTSKSGQAGDTVTLMAGSGIYWRSGSAVASGSLIDVTQGEELSSGMELRANHRYLAAEEVVISVTSQSAQWLVEGIWKSAGGSGGTDLPFTDVSESSWYYDAVCYVYQQGLYNGTSDTEFSPSAPMQRGMMTTVLYRLAGSPPVSYAPIFNDVPDNLWYTDGTVWAGQNGVVAGTGNQLFEPEDNIARQQIAMILYNYARYAGADTSARSDLSVFSDANRVSAWAQDAVSWAVSAGIIRGGDNEQILPGNSATRAEVAAMLQRFESWLAS